MDKFTIGIDISKQKFDAAYKKVDGRWVSRVFENNHKGFNELRGWIPQDFSGQIHVVMEATGRYGEDLAYFCHGAGFDVSIINPAQIKHYGRSLLRRTKTDKADARLIAEFADRHPDRQTLPLWQPLSQAAQALKEQVRCLNSLKKDATQISNRLEAAKDPKVRNIYKQNLRQIQTQLKALEAAIREIIKQDQGVKENFKLLTSIPGIGEVTAIILLAELPDLSPFKCAKQLAAYAGLNPSIRTSGTSVRGRERMSKMGHALLRKALFLPALSIMVRQTPLRPFIDRLREKGKKGKVIVGAVMHKLLHIIFGVMKRQVAFQG